MILCVNVFSGVACPQFNELSFKEQQKRKEKERIRKFKKGRMLPKPTIISIKWTRVEAK
jgi:hypothetical protein